MTNNWQIYITIQLKLFKEKISTHKGLYPPQKKQNKQKQNKTKQNKQKKTAKPKYSIMQKLRCSITWIPYLIPTYYVGTYTIYNFCKSAFTCTRTSHTLPVTHKGELREARKDKRDKREKREESKERRERIQNREAAATAVIICRALKIYLMHESCEYKVLQMYVYTVPNSLHGPNPFDTMN